MKKIEKFIEKAKKLAKEKTLPELYTMLGKEVEKHKTKVVFRKYQGGDIVALFPDEKWDTIGNIMSYEHIGQHGAAAYNWVIKITAPAKPKEYAPLKRELESIGYNLDIRKRR